MDGIESMLKIYEPNAEQIANMIDECDGWSKINDLQNHENFEIYKLAYDLINQYFLDDETADEVI